MAISVVGAQGSAVNNATTLTMTKPSGVQVGDLMIAFFSTSQDDTTATGVTCSGWSTAPNGGLLSSGTRPRTATLYKVAVSGDVTATNYTFTKTGGAVQQNAGGIIVLRGVDTANPFLANQTAYTTTATTNAYAETASVSWTKPAGTDNVCVVNFFTYVKSGTANTFGFNKAATGAQNLTTATENFDYGDDWVNTAGFTDLFTGASGTTGVRRAPLTTTKTGTTTQTASSPNTPVGATFVLRAAVTAVAPTVGAGADATIDQYDTFSRTATENDGGAAITSRAWTVLSGPNQVGATIGTAAALNWAPTVGGSYVLRYTATNAQGSGTDDVAVTVNALNFPVTAPLKLQGASGPNTSDRSSTRSANIVLSATRTGSKQTSGATSANIKIAASAIGQKRTYVTANIRLFAAAINVGRPGEGSVTANIKLAASTSDRSSDRSNTVSSNLVLGATRTGTKNVSVVRTAALILTALLDGAKNVPSTRTANIKLQAAIANVLHNTPVTRTALIKLQGASSNPVHISLNKGVTAPLKLQGTRATSSVRFEVAVGPANIRLFASAFVQRIVTEAEGIVRPRADNTTVYDLVAVARIPQTSGLPSLFEIDPIDWVSLTHTEELNGIPTLSATAKINNLTEPILQRLRNMEQMPTELWLYRNGKQVFGGPLMGYNVNDESITFSAQGIMAYLKSMYVTKDLNYKNVDQFSVVTGLIDQWQVLPYGNFGIDTSGISPSGVLRTVTYLRKELHMVDKRIDDLTKSATGFDISIDPTNRKLQLYYPLRGVDRSTGEDAVVFDDRNITSSNITGSIAPTDLASEGLGTANSSAEDVLIAEQSNLELRAKYGRTGIVQTFSDVTEQAVLNSSVQALIDARKEALLIPGPNVRVTVDADLSMYDVGDTVDYQLHSQLAVSGAYRIRKRSVAVSETGTESVSVEFV